MVEEYDTKCLMFRRVGRYPKTEYWLVLSKKHRDELGFVRWYNSWRQYTFSPNMDTTFNIECLKDISEFLKRLMDDWKSHAPDEVGGTDEGSKGSGSGPSKAVNEPES